MRHLRCVFYSVLALLAVAASTLLCASPLLAGPGPGEAPPRSITVVSDDNYPPYIFRNDEGAIQGLLVDEWRAWEKATGIAVELVAMNWEQAQRFMLEGRADVIDTIFFNKERAKFYDFTKPYARLDVPVFVHKDLGGVSNPASLHGFTVGVKRGDACIAVLQSFGIHTLKEYDSYLDLIHAARRHDIRIFSIDKPPALYYLYKFGMTGEFRSAFVLNTGEFHRAVRKGDAGLLQTVEAGFAAIPAQERKAIEDKWLGTPLVPGEYMHVLLVAGLSVMGLLLALLGFNAILRRRVRAKTTELAKALSLLRESEVLYRTMFETASEGICRLDALSVITYVNEKMASLLGCSPEAMIGHSVAEFTFPEDCAAHQERMNHRQTGQPGIYERRFKRCDESELWTLVSASALYDEAGQFAGSFGMFTDITQRRQSEVALRESEEKYRSVIENITDVFYRTDAQGRLDMVSPSGVALLRYGSEEEMLGLTAETLWLHPEQRPALLGQLQQHGQVNDYEVTLKTRDGTPVYVSTSSRVRLGAAGQVLGVEGTFRDISERKRVDEALRGSEERYRRIVETANEGIITIDEQRKITYCNKVMAGLLGFTEEELLRLNFWDLFFEADMPLLAAEGQRRRSGLQSRIERRFRRKDGSELWTIFAGTPIFDESGVYRGSFAMVSNITQHKLAQEALRKSENQYRGIFELAAVGICHCSLEGVFLSVNRKLTEIFGYSEAELLGMNFREISHPDDLAEDLGHVRQVLSGQSTGFEMEKRYIRKDQVVIWVHLSVTMVSDSAGLQGYFIGVFEDITERKQLKEQLEFRALHDPLTGLANRTLCQDRIAQANERSVRKPEETFAIVFIDLDRFKFVNDSLGHEAGDRVLREVANRLLTCARKLDTVCRYGGDEFILVLEDISPRQTVRTIQRVRESLKEPLSIGGQGIRVEASYGIVYAPLPDCQPEDLLRNANIALHRAKLLGRDRIVAYRRGMHEAAIQTMSLQSDMRRGLDAAEFFMVYQPIFRMSDNSLAGFEALIRWRHPERGLIGPGDFIPMAEESGFIYELGNFALSQSCTDMVGLMLDLPAGDHLTVSVNLSPRQLSRQGLADQIEQTLLSSGLPPSSLVLEITESSIMKHPEASAHILAKLKGKGVGIAIDDFGTGYSSMSALRKLPIDRLKVDMSFVKKMSESNEDREIIRAIITLAHSLNLKTVAEGIETEEQRKALQGMQCDLGQGYLCSQPLALADVPQAIRQKFCSLGT